MAFLFFSSNVFGQAESVYHIVAKKGPGLTGGLTDTLDVSKMFIRPMLNEIIKFKSYAEQQAFYRNYGHLISGFDSSMLCKHIYVAVEQPDIKVKDAGPTYTLGVMQRRVTGKHEGQDIVCVKCFHTRKQVFDYGGK